MSASKRDGDHSCVDGFEIEIFKLVKEEATPEQWKQWLRAPLEHAAAGGNVGLFTRLMDAGADGEAGWRGCDGRTLLGAAACGKKSGKMVRALLEAGARRDVNVLFGAKCESALAPCGSAGGRKDLHGAYDRRSRPNLRDREDSSPLHSSAEAGHDGVVGSLLLKGAQVDARTHFGRTPLHLAASEGHTLCISELLLGGAEKDVDDYKGETPLFTAAENNHLGGVEKLLAAGANRGIRANNGYSPLEIAANSGHATIVKAFLDEDRSAVDATDENGYTALHCCATVPLKKPVGDNGDAVRVLLKAGADVDAKTTTNGHCSTPLHVAVDRRIASTGTIRALLEGGANVNVRDELDETPLHVACMLSCVASVEILLRWGADEKLTNEDEETPADVIGEWKENDPSDEEIEADNQRICRMLAHAPADRSWRRRGWLVLSRSCPTRVQIANGSSSGNFIGSSKGYSSKVARVSGEDSGGDDEETEDQMMVDLRDLVGRLIGLEADGLFCLVVSFL